MLFLFMKKVSYLHWSHRLTVRTSGSHPGNRGSIPRGITKVKTPLGVFTFCPKNSPCGLFVGESKGGVMSDRSEAKQDGRAGVAEECVHSICDRFRGITVTSARKVYEQRFYKCIFSFCRRHGIL